MIGTIAVVSLIFGLLLAVERWLPLRSQTRALWPRLGLNLLLSAMAFVTAALIVKPTVTALVGWTGEQSFGLIHIGKQPDWLKAVLGFLLLDLTFYYWHIATHKLPILWRFHNVHHYDPDLDVSTGFRFHFGEVGLSVFFRIIQISIIGLSPLTYAVYELVFQGNTLFHHSNVRLPIQLERIMNHVLVTPRMHGIHHSQLQSEANSNYGVVFPWWDRLHRTLRLNVPQARINIGVPAYTLPEDNQLKSLLIAPFCKQRDYWKKPGGSEAGKASTDSKSQKGHLVE